MAATAVRVSVVVFPQCDPAMVYGVFDALWAAGRLCNPRFGRSTDCPIFEPRLVAADLAPLTLVTGVTIMPQQSISAVGTTDILFVPNVLVNSSDEIAALDRRLISWIRQIHAAGASIYAACGGPLLLAEAGLLEGRAATTHWSYVPLFRQRFPNVVLHPERLLVQSGAVHSVVCSGGASSWQDLCLLLIARYAGMAEAQRVSKLFLFQWHRDGQLPYAAMIGNCDHADAVVERCQEWLGDNYARKDVVAALRAKAGLPRRTFARRFKAATGYAPLAYVQALRIEEAKQQLETAGDLVDVVARAVGYEDATAFRRLFRRLTGLSPADYRRKVRAPKPVAHSLAAAHGPTPVPAPPSPPTRAIAPATTRSRQPPVT